MITYKDLTYGLDGNCAYALYGIDLQEGEAEFVEFKPGYEFEYMEAAADILLRRLNGAPS